MATLFRLSRTILVAAFLNGVTALSALFLLGAASPAADASSDEQGSSERRNLQRTRSLGQVALAATFVAGFASLSFEVIWTRLLLFYITGTTYAFSIMLATFLGAIALGSYLFGRFGRHEQRRDVAGGLPLALAGLLAVVVEFLPSGFAQGRIYPRPEGPPWLQLLSLHDGAPLGGIAEPNIGVTVGGHVGAGKISALQARGQVLPRSRLPLNRLQPLDVTRDYLVARSILQGDVAVVGRSCFDHRDRRGLHAGQLR